MQDEDEFNNPELLKVREWRHRIQKTFLGRNPPNALAMPAMNELFTVVEAYDGMTDERLRHSKIGVVMRHIAALPSPPLDEAYQFRARARVLHDKWYHIVPETDKTVGPQAAISTSVAHASDEPTVAPAAAPGNKEVDTLTDATKGL